MVFKCKCAKIGHAKITQTDVFNYIHVYMSYHFLCNRGIRPARTEQFLFIIIIIIQIDAFFMFPSEIKRHVVDGTVEELTGMPMVCMLEGNALMTRKDSQLPPLWNVGFNKARSNGRFQKICADTDRLHGK